MSSDKPTRYIVRFEVCDEGIDAPDTYQGFGTSFTNFEDSTYGIGDNPREALSDALESMAQSLPSGAYTDALESRIIGEFIDWREDRPPTLDDVPDSPGAMDDRKEERDDTPLFDVVEHSSFYAVRRRDTGDEMPMGDGVDTLFTEDGTALSPGTEDFRAAWESSLNSDPAETLEAYWGSQEDDCEDAPELYCHVGIRWACEPDPMESVRTADGTLLSHNEGYPVYYLMRDDDMPRDAPYVVCADCANKPRTPECHPIAQEAHWEGPPLTCEECNAQIESAYGDPDAPADDNA